MTEKRMIGDTDYEVIQSEWAGGKEYLLAENKNATYDERYLVCKYTTLGIIGQYVEAVTGGDLAEAKQEFADRVNSTLADVQRELDERGLPAELFTAEHCAPHSYDQCINGAVVAIKAEVLAPEYRRGSEQLVYVVGGFGANANARGNAVFCHHLSTGEGTRFERYHVLGIVRKLPDWVKERLTAVKAQIAAEQTKSTKDRGDAR